MNEKITLFVGFFPKVASKLKHQLHNHAGTRLLTNFSEIDVDVVEVPDNHLHQAVKDYQISQYVSFIEKNTSDLSFHFVNDRYYEHPVRTSMDGYQNQWGLRRVKPEPAWKMVQNLKHKTVIAILDTGIDPDHPDLASKIVQPVNFTTKDRHNYLDTEGHGTHVAGIAAAVTNNNMGIAGISLHTADIMPVKVIGPKGGQTKWVISGILYAVHHGAKVINISFGAATYSQALQLAINYAWQRGVVIVAAAGNQGRDHIEYPAGYNFVLAVSATTAINDLAAFSNRGINIGITAPGMAILSTTPTYLTRDKLPSYDTLHGTSQAAPFVSGLVALLLSLYPDLTNAEAVQIIQKSASPIDEETKQWNPFFGYGLLNAANAVRRKTGRMIHRKSGKRRKNITIRRSRGNNSRKKSPTKRIYSEQTYRSRSPVKKGSFYGQVVDQSGKPIANATVYARKDGKTIIKYTTRTNVPIENNGMGTDGMFRLPNLFPGKYSLLVQLPGQRAVKITRASITGGADTIVQLVCRGDS